MSPAVAEPALTRAIDFPEKLQPLFLPKRYKILTSGRGASKSWSIARALLVKGTKRRLRILCAREVQRSIKDSVHELLSTQIPLLGLEAHYQVLETKIVGLNGTEFIFSGLLQHTINSIKSYEGVDIVWVEEAQTVSKKSWDILIPTIRKEDSEIWISLNPELDTDETYTRFVVNPPPDSIVLHLSYRDNPWFPEVLERERRHCELTQPDDYKNIWEGEPRSAVVGAIFAHEIAAMIRENRLTHVPYDPRLKVHVVLDLGWEDFMAVGYWQRIRSDLRCIKYFEEQYTRTDQIAARVAGDRLNWGTVWLPHDGFSAERKTGKSDAQIFRSFGFKVQQVPNVGLEIGIRLLRQVFPQMAWNKPETPRLVECAKRYRRHMTREGVAGEPEHDQYSHGMDQARYAALVAERMRNEPDYEGARVPAWQPMDSGMGALGSLALGVLMPLIL